MSQWFECTDDAGTTICVNFERATTMETVYGMSKQENRTLITFEQGHSIKVQNTEEVILGAIGAKRQNA